MAVTAVIPITGKTVHEMQISPISFVKTLINLLPLKSIFTFNYSYKFRIAEFK